MMMQMDLESLWQYLQSYTHPYAVKQKALHLFLFKVHKLTQEQGTFHRQLLQTNLLTTLAQHFVQEVCLVLQAPEWGTSGSHGHRSAPISSGEWRQTVVDKLRGFFCDTAGSEGHGFLLLRVLHIVTDVAKNFRPTGECIKGLCSVLVLCMKFLCETFMGSTSRLPSTLPPNWDSDTLGVPVAAETRARSPEVLSASAPTFSCGCPCSSQALGSIPPPHCTPLPRTLDFLRDGGSVHHMLYSGVQLNAGCTAASPLSDNAAPADDSVESDPSVCDPHRHMESVLHLLTKLLHNLCLLYPNESFLEIFVESNLWVDLLQFLPRFTYGQQFGVVPPPHLVPLARSTTPASHSPTAPQQFPTPPCTSSLGSVEYPPAGLRASMSDVPSGISEPEFGSQGPTRTEALLPETPVRMQDASPCLHGVHQEWAWLVASLFRTAGSDTDTVRCTCARVNGTHNPLSMLLALVEYQLDYLERGPNRSEALMSAVVTMCEAALMRICMCLPLSSEPLDQFGRENGYALFSRVFGLVGKHSYFNNHPALVSRLLHLGCVVVATASDYAHFLDCACDMLKLANDLSPVSSGLLADALRAYGENSHRDPKPFKGSQASPRETLEKTRSLCNERAFNVLLQAFNSCEPCLPDGQLPTLHATGKAEICILKRTLMMCLTRILQRFKEQYIKADEYIPPSAPPTPPSNPARPSSINIVTPPAASTPSSHPEPPMELDMPLQITGTGSGLWHYRPFQSLISHYYHFMTQEMQDAFLECFRTMLLYSASPEYETGRAQKVWVEDIKSLLTLLTSFPCPPSYQLCESVIWCLDSCTRLVSALEELVGLTAPQRRRSGLTPMRTPAYISDLLFQAGFMSSLVRLLSNGFLVTHSRFLISVLMLLCMNIWDSRRNRMRFIMEHSSVTLLYSYLIYAGPYVDDPPIDTPNYRHGFSARFYSPGALRSMESFRYLPLCLSILERLCIKDVHQKFCIMDHLPFLLQNNYVSIGVEAYETNRQSLQHQLLCRHCLMESSWSMTAVPTVSTCARDPSDGETRPQLRSVSPGIQVPYVQSAPSPSSNKLQHRDSDDNVLRSPENRSFGLSPSWTATDMVYDRDVADTWDTDGWSEVYSSSMRSEDDALRGAHDVPLDAELQFHGRPPYNKHFNSSFDLPAASPKSGRPPSPPVSASSVLPSSPNPNESSSSIMNMVKGMFSGLFSSLGSDPTSSVGDGAHESPGQILQAKAERRKAVRVCSTPTIHMHPHYPFSESRSPVQKVVVPDMLCSNGVQVLRLRKQVLASLVHIFTENRNAKDAFRKASGFTWIVSALDDVGLKMEHALSCCVDQGANTPRGKPVLSLSMDTIPEEDLSTSPCQRYLRLVLEVLQLLLRVLTASLMDHLENQRYFRSKVHYTSLLAPLRRCQFLESLPLAFKVTQELLKVACLTESLPLLPVNQAPNPFCSSELGTMEYPQTSDSSWTSPVDAAPNAAVGYYIHNPEVFVLLVQMMDVPVPTMQTDLATVYILEYLTFLIGLTSLNKLQVHKSRLVAFLLRTFTPRLRSLGPGVPSQGPGADWQPSSLGGASTPQQALARLCDAVMGLVQTVGRHTVAVSDLVALLALAREPALSDVVLETFLYWSRTATFASGPHDYVDLQHALSAGSLLYEHPPLQKLLDAEPRESVARRPPATQPCVVLPPVHYTPWPPTKEGYTVTWWFQFEKLNLLSGPPSDPYKEELCLFSLMMDGETQTMECLLTRSCTFVVRLTEMPEDLGTARSSWTLGSRANQSGSRQPLVVEFTELFFEDQEWYFCTLAHTFGAQGSNRSTQFFTLWVNGKPVEKKEAKVERVPHHRAKHSLDQIIIGALSAAMPMPKHRRWLSLQMGTLQVFEGALSDWEVMILFFMGPDFISNYDEPLITHHISELINPHTLDTFPGELSRWLYEFHSGGDGRELLDLSHQFVMAFACRSGRAFVVCRTKTVVHSNLFAAARTPWHPEAQRNLRARAHSVTAGIAADADDTAEVAFDRSDLSDPETGPLPKSDRFVSFDTLEQAIDYTAPESASSAMHSEKAGLDDVDALPQRVRPNQTSTSSSQWLYISSPAVLAGNAVCVSRFTLKGALRAIGGMNTAVQLVSLAQTQRQQTLALQIVCHLLKWNWANYREMERIDGYSLLGHYLKQPRMQVTEAILNIVLDMVGVYNAYNNNHKYFRNRSVEYDKANHRTKQGVVSNIKAFYHLVLDFGIWQKGDAEPLQVGLLSHLCNLVDDHRYKTYHLGLFQFLDVFPGLLHRLQFQSSLPTFTSADASSLAPNPLPLPLEQCPGWDQRLIPCTMRLLYTLTTSAFNASEAVRMLCPLMDFIINTSSDTGHSAFVYQAVLQTPHVLHHSAEPDAPLPVHTWRTAAIRLLLLLLQQLPAGVHDSVLGHYSWEGLLPMLGVVCPITRELLLQVFAVMLKSAKCYDKFTASEFKGPEILYSHLHRRNKMSLSGFPSAPSMSSEGVASPLPTDPAACGPALGGPYHARHGREASTDDAASAPDAAAAPSQSTSSRASPLMTDSSVSSLDIEWEEDATTLDCFEPSVRELQIIVNLLLPPDRAFSILASPECPDLFARYFAPYLRLPRRHPNADAYLRYLRQCIVAAQGGQEGEDGQDLTNPIPSNTEHRRSSNSPGIATASPRPSHAAAARPPPATPAGGSGLGYASALNIEDFLTPLFSFLGAVVPPAPSKGDPCIDTLNTCNIRFKRMLLLTALHDIFVHGSQSVKDVFIRKECHFLLMRCLQGRVSAGDRIMFHAAFGFLCDLVCNSAEVTTDKSSILESVLYGLLTLRQEYDLSFLQHLQQHLLHAVLCTFHARMWAPQEHRGPHKSVPSIIMPFATFAETAVDHVLLWNCSFSGSPSVSTSDVPSAEASSTSSSLGAWPWSWGPEASSRSSAPGPPEAPPAALTSSRLEIAAGACLTACVQASEVAPEDVAIPSLRLLRPDRKGRPRQEIGRQAGLLADGPEPAGAAHSPGPPEAPGAASPPLQRRRSSSAPTRRSFTPPKAPAKSPSPTRHKSPQDSLPSKSPRDSLQWPDEPMSPVTEDDLTRSVGSNLDAMGAIPDEWIRHPNLLPGLNKKFGPYPTDSKLRAYTYFQRDANNFLQHAKREKEASPRAMPEGPASSSSSVSSAAPSTRRSSLSGSLYPPGPPLMYSPPPRAARRSRTVTALKEMPAVDRQLVSSKHKGTTDFSYTPNDCRGFLYWLTETVQSCLNRLKKREVIYNLRLELALVKQLKKLLQSTVSGGRSHPRYYKHQHKPFEAVTFALLHLLHPSSVTDKRRRDEDKKSMEEEIAETWFGASQHSKHQRLWLLEELSRDELFVTQVLFQTAPLLARAPNPYLAYLARKLWKNVLEQKESVVRDSLAPDSFAAVQTALANFKPSTEFEPIKVQFQEHVIKVLRDREARSRKAINVESKMAGLRLDLAPGPEQYQDLAKNSQQRLSQEKSRTEAALAEHFDWWSWRQLQVVAQLGAVVEYRLLLQPAWGDAMQIFTRRGPAPHAGAWRLDATEGPFRNRTRLTRELNVPLVCGLGLVLGADAGEELNEGSGGPLGAGGSRCEPPLVPTGDMDEGVWYLDGRFDLLARTSPEDLRGAVKLPCAKITPMLKVDGWLILGGNALWFHASEASPPSPKPKTPKTPAAGPLPGPRGPPAAQTSPKADVARGDMQQPDSWEDVTSADAGEARCPPPGGGGTPAAAGAAATGDAARECGDKASAPHVPPETTADGDRMQPDATARAEREGAVQHTPDASAGAAEAAVLIPALPRKGDCTADSAPPPSTTDPAPPLPPASPVAGSAAKPPSSSQESPPGAPTATRSSARTLPSPAVSSQCESSAVPTSTSSASSPSSSSSSSSSAQASASPQSSPPPPPPPLPSSPTLSPTFGLSPSPAAPPLTPSTATSFSSAPFASPLPMAEQCASRTALNSERRQWLLHARQQQEVRQRTTVRYADVVAVYRRRYMLQHVALEVFTSGGQGIFFAFQSPEQREQVYTKLQSRASQPAYTPETLRQITECWREGDISNFEYLMFLNTVSGRSFNDVSQYPVFPYIISDYDSPHLDLRDPSIYRDLTKPMGCQTDFRLERTCAKYETLKAQYESWLQAEGCAPLSPRSRSGKRPAPADPAEPLSPFHQPPYHYGSHYSSRAAVLHYLIRVQPFTDCFLDLNGLGLDMPDRTFHSARDAWLLSSGNSPSDVKELIPEFFYCHEFLTNSNGVDFGRLQSGEAVTDVALPAWAQGCPRTFVALHREALESEHVSSKLHHWIDLIFGHKQTGAEAERAYNRFHPFTYEGGVDLDAIHDPITRDAVTAQVSNYGQTPAQLFQKAHPRRHVEALYRRTTRRLTAPPTGVPLGPVADDVFGMEIMPVVRAEVLGPGPSWRGPVCWQSAWPRVHTHPEGLIAKQWRRLEPAIPIAGLRLQSRRARPPAWGVHGGGLYHAGSPEADDDLVFKTSYNKLLLLAPRAGQDPGPDGAQYVAFGFWDGSMRLCSLQTSKVLACHFTAHHAGMTISCTGLSRDGRYLAVGYDSGLVEVHCVLSGASRGPAHPSASALRPPDRQTPATSRSTGIAGTLGIVRAPPADKSLSLDDKADGGGFRFLPPQGPPSLRPPPRARTPTPSGFTLPVPQAASFLGPGAPLHGHTDAVVCMNVCTEYGVLVTGSMDGRCLVWDLNRLVYVRELHVPPEDQGVAEAEAQRCVALVEVSVLNANVAAWYQDIGAGDSKRHVLYLWTVNDEFIASAHFATRASSLLFCGHVLFVGMQDGTVVGLDAFDLSRRCTLQAHLQPHVPKKSPIGALAVNEDKTRLYTGDEDGWMIAWGVE